MTDQPAMSVSERLRPAPRTGRYEDPYWEHAARQELRLQQCECGHFRYPPGPSCPRCLSETYAWTALCGHGTLLSWAVFQRKYFDSIPVPYAVVSVATDEGPILVGNMSEPTSGLSAGAAVEVYFEQARTVDGTPISLPQWRLAEPPQRRLAR